MKELAEIRHRNDRMYNILLVGLIAPAIIIAYMVSSYLNSGYEPIPNSLSPPQSEMITVKSYTMRGFEFTEEFSVYQIRRNASYGRLKSLLSSKEYQDRKKKEKILSENKKFLIVANKKNPLGKYVPEKLTKVDDVEMVKEAADALKALQQELSGKGITLRATSAYRSFDWQEALYNDYLTRHTKAEVDSFSSRPGYSDHQTGLAVDVNFGKGVPKESCHAFNLYTNKDGSDCWKDKGIQEAHKLLPAYGFIVRYPEGKQKITGYQPEYWHFRYVGKEAAQYITERGLTLEEFTGVKGGDYVK